MSDLRALQPSFTSGELSPALWARVDLAKYASGLKYAVNVFIHPHGGISNRSGLEFRGEVKDSTKRVKLIPFQFNVEQTYELEFGPGYMRVWRGGSQVLSGMTPYEIVTPYTNEAHLKDLVFAQEADVLFITHPSYPPQKLSRFADDNWTIGPVLFEPRSTPPATLNGSAFVRRKNTANENVSYGVTSVSASGAESARSALATVQIEPESEDGGRVLINWPDVPGAVLYRVYRGSTTDFLGEVQQSEIEFPQEAYLGTGSGRLPGTSDPGAPPVPTGVTATRVFGEIMRYVVATIDEDSGEESLPSPVKELRNALEYKGNRNDLSWSAVPGASAYIVYRELNGLYGYVGRTETTFFTDNNIVPDTADGPQKARNPFDGPNKYPRAVTFVEQRLALASSYEDPQAVWLSQSANYLNFGVSEPAKVSDAVTFRMRSREVNEIRAMLPVRGLMLLTSGAEWLVTGGSQADAIAPGAIKIDNQGFRGAAKVQPVVVGNTILFAQERGGVVRDFSYDFSADGFSGQDLTILARHLFEGREIAAWAYAQAPYSIVWVVMSDGSLLSLTYMKEHEVWGWTRHESSGGFFEDVIVVSEDMENVPYFVVRRTIEGVERRYIERLRTREFADVKDCFFVDSGLSLKSDVAFTTFSNLDHLEGREVVALADGNVVRGLTVTGGSVTLPNPSKIVHIGLPMSAAIQTLDLDLGQVRGLGTVQGREKSVSELTLRVEKTRGIFVGPKDTPRGQEGGLTELKQRQNEAWNEPILLYTGDVSITPSWDWNKGGNMFIRQFDPLPMTILAIMPDFTLGR